MNIQIQGTQVVITGDRIIGFALNNLVNRFEATTDKDASWTYTLKAYMTKIQKTNIINLSRDGQTIYVELTRDMMPVGGRYVMQFVATKGELVDQTDKFDVWVEDSLDPTPQYTPIPSEFYQFRTEMQDIYADTKVLYDDIKNIVATGSIDCIKAGTERLPIIDKCVTIPMATIVSLGLVKGSTQENGVAIASDGTMQVNNVNVNRLSQTQGDSLILDSGDSQIR